MVTKLHIGASGLMHIQAMKPLTRPCGHVETTTFIPAVLQVRLLTKTNETYKKSSTGGCFE